jgi:hypothetical protein
MPDLGEASFPNRPNKRQPPGSTSRSRSYGVADVPSAASDDGFTQRTEGLAVGSRSDDREDGVAQPAR